MKTVKASELLIGDVVEVFDGAFGTAIVKNIKDGVVHFFRPYGSNFNTIYTDGIICLIGTEEVEVPINSNSEYKLLRRQFDSLK